MKWQEVLLKENLLKEKQLELIIRKNILNVKKYTKQRYRDETDSEESEEEEHEEYRKSK